MTLDKIPKVGSLWRLDFLEDGVFMLFLKDLPSALFPSGLFWRIETNRDGKVDCAEFVEYDYDSFTIFRKVND